jgi:hypoxanthine-DNA glycosylase
MMIQSFAPVEDGNARVLVLGSMPGKASLAAGQYYAHPRNLFWPIMGKMLGFHPDVAYQERLAALKANRIALWDVLASCERVTSLDAGIVGDSEMVNDFETFFNEHRRISDVFFNGRKAEQTFLKKVKPFLKPRRLALHLLPSTSPAHAAISYQEKLDAWRKITMKKR